MSRQKFRGVIAVALVSWGWVLVGEGSAAPIVFSAAGADSTAIQGSVDAFRAALGNPNNANNAGPLLTGRREINWDGGVAATTISGNPFNGFQNIRGALFSTPPPGT